MYTFERFVIRFLYSYCEVLHEVVGRTGINIELFTEGPTSIYTKLFSHPPLSAVCSFPFPIGKYGINHHTYIQLSPFY
jgi:hypothetical protein